MRGRKRTRGGVGREGRSLREGKGKNKRDQEAKNGGKEGKSG